MLLLQSVITSTRYLHLQYEHLVVEFGNFIYVIQFAKLLLAILVVLEDLYQEANDFSWTKPWSSYCY